MKKALFTGMLLASQLCSAQRWLEVTNSSWIRQNHSVETIGGTVITGFTDINPNSGKLSPAFKLTNLAGTPTGSFYTNIPDDCFLMDFVIKPNTQTIVMACMTDTPGPGTPYKMFLVETTFTGAIVQIFLEYSATGTSMIPEEVIYSQTSNQVVVVGSSVNGFMTSANTYTTPKSGFILAVSANNFSAVSFCREFNTAAGGTMDSDMLASVAEVPGWGYFMTGSANNPTANEQNMLNAGVTYAGAIVHSKILDNTNFMQAGASALYVGSRVYVLSNNSALHTFQLGSFNPTTGALLSSFSRYLIGGLPIGAGVDVNGFNLRQTQNGQINIAGYIHNTSTALAQRLTPFTILVNQNFTFVYGKMLQSGNNVTMAPYFDEGGASVYINTPDIAVYSVENSRAYIVNPNSVNGGYDLSLSNPVTAGGCERKFNVTIPTVSPADLGPANFIPLGITPANYSYNLNPRPVQQSILCQQAFLAEAPPAATLFPNPATDQLNVETDAEIREVIISDLKGNRVLAVTPSGRDKTTVSIDISGLKAGVYVLDITDAEGVLRREKFIKE